MNSPIRVLHVDDDPAFTSLTAEYLARVEARIEVETETSPRDGLARLERGDVDCVVSDYDMGEMDGVDFLEAVRASYPDLPFLLFTGKGSEAVAADAVDAGVTSYLQKGGTDTFELLANRIRNEVTDYRITTSYRQYKTVIDSLTDAVYVTDETGRFTDVNAAFLDLTGYDEETVLGSHVSLIKGPEAIETAESHLRRLLSDEGPTDVLFELDIETADGDRVPCEDHMGLVPFEGGQFRGSVGTLRVIADRRESEAFRRRFYTLASDPDRTFEGTCRGMLELGCERLGLDEGKLVRTDAERGRHETILAARDYSREGAVAELSRTYCRRVVESRSAVAVHDAVGQGWEEDPAFADFGHACYVGAEVVVEGEPFGTVCFFGPEPRQESFTDAELTFVELISQGIGHEVARRRARTSLDRRKKTLGRIHDVVSDRSRGYEARIRGLLELGQDVLNSDYATVSHISEEEFRIETLAASDGALQEGDVLPLSKTACERTITEGQSQAIPRFRDDSRYRDHPVHAELGLGCYIGTPVYQDGEPYGTLCFVGQSGRAEPFTEWETTVVELMSQWVSFALDERASREALAHERDRLDEFAGVVSHDLRNPLQVVRGRLELAMGEHDSEHLEQARDALDRAEALIDDLLTLARSGETVGDRQPVDLASLVAECWRTVAPERAKLTVDIDDGVEVDADRGRLRQLLENLFRNSVEHGSTNGRPQAGDSVAHGGETGSVSVTVGCCDGGFYVADDGPGIPAEKREDVVEYGYTTSEDGTGLGLAIVTEIATAHGWDVVVTEADGGGARFEIVDSEAVVV
jgi:PAS domain S-box-containing protein